MPLAQMIKVCEALSNATRTMRFPNVLFHLNVFDNYHGICEEARDSSCTIPTFALIKAWNRTEDHGWSNEIVVPQFVFLPTTMYTLPWKDKTPVGEQRNICCLLPAAGRLCLGHCIMAATFQHALVTPTELASVPLLIPMYTCGSNSTPGAAKHSSTPPPKQPLRKYHSSRAWACRSLLPWHWLLLWLPPRPQQVLPDVAQLPDSP
jgi:hypothetical protein